MTKKKDIASIADELVHTLNAKPSRFWYILFTVACILFAGGLYSLYETIFTGIGTWGTNNTVGWGLGIINFVWWVGIAHAGTFISAILLLFQQKWRTSINRAAETMTIIAVLCAGFFPVVHMGRPHLAFFVFPYPNTRSLWVNFNSPLLWDVFAISTYLIVSLLFWYLGLIPDMAMLKNKIRNRFKRFVYRKLSLNWAGSSLQWKRYETITIIIAGLAAPLVLSVHTIVSMDFATSLVKGWHSTIFPPYFVAGAIFSGFAMVQTLMIILRKAMKLEKYITEKHIKKINNIILTTGFIVASAYMIELWAVFTGNDVFEKQTFIHRISGNASWTFWLMICCNVFVPQLLWFKRFKKSISISLLVSIIINIGMWFERYIIVVTPLQTDYLPATWDHYVPTLTEFGLFAGSIGFFIMMFLLFIRMFPVISLSEIKGEIDDDKVLYS